MLGWFKKKFKKDSADTQAEETVEIAVEEISPEVEADQPPPVVKEELLIVDVSVEEETPSVEKAALAGTKKCQGEEDEIEKKIQPKNMGDEKKSLFSRLSQRLSKSRSTFVYQLDALFLGKKEINAALLDDLEEILITAD
ncbi:MAG: hypothetical protein JRJ68_09665, partial [Deltaproteobacteria bacterium]|nr:hypothetical protein [Deltaproteobacteria bacterium]